MASAPFSTAALAHNQSPAGASNSGRANWARGAASVGAHLDSTAGAPVSDPARPPQIPTRRVGDRRSAVWGGLAVLVALSRCAPPLTVLVLSFVVIYSPALSFLFLERPRRELDASIFRFGWRAAEAVLALVFGQSYKFKLAAARFPADGNRGAPIGPVRVQDARFAGVRK